VPELPDITIYVEALRTRIVGRNLQSVIIKSPFLLRTFNPPVESIERQTVTSVDRLGKRIVLGFPGELFAVIHLMIAGRLLWRPGKRLPKTKIDLAAFIFETATPEPSTLLLTEASPKHRASLHLIQGRRDLQAQDRGGIDPTTASPADVQRVLTLTSRTLKRALTDPATFSGIGNAYSDEILHAARLSPFKRTDALSSADLEAVTRAIRETLERWTNTLRADFKDRFPDTGEITAFRPDFAVHGKFKKTCPTCATPVQRVVRAENEFNYCPTCQTNGKILADRALSRLLGDDYPKTIEDLEAD
jgi:formamidopyrimidine-DNA glycosylase